MRQRLVIPSLTICMAIVAGVGWVVTRPAGGQQPGEEMRVVGVIVPKGPGHIAVRVEPSGELLEFAFGDRPELQGLIGELEPGRRVEVMARFGEGVWHLEELHPLGAEPGGPRPPGGPVAYDQGFDQAPVPGWELDPGWEIAAYANGRRGLHGRGHGWARFVEGGWGPCTLRLRVRLVRGTVHINYHVDGPRRYMVGLHQSGVYLGRQNDPGSFASSLPTWESPLALGQWYDIEVTQEGQRLQVRVNGSTAIDYDDPDPLAHGGLAFETLEDSEAWVDDLAVGPPVFGSAGTVMPGPGRGPGPALSGGPPPGRVGMWVRLGGPLGGLGYDVRMQPNDPMRMYVTDRWAGVFVSSDGGGSWTSANAGITIRDGTSGDAIPVFCLTLDPTDPKTIWCGTMFQAGLFKSTDRGQTWTKMANGIPQQNGLTFRGITVDPHQPSIVYAAAEASSWWSGGSPRNGVEFDLTGGVIYKTTNGGANWTQVWLGQNLARYIWVDPRDTGVLYASTGIFDREAANSDPVHKTPGGVGIIKSTDGGQTWTPTNKGLGNLYVGTLFMHPTNPDVLLAGAGNNTYPNDAGVYLSEDAGGSWRRVLKEVDAITAVEFTRADPNVAYAGSSHAVYRSDDRGRTWQRVTPGGNAWGPPGVRSGFPIDLEVDPNSPNRLFANNYGGGNFLSLDGGRTWSNASVGYTGAAVRGVAVDAAAGGRVYAAARSGLFASSDWGATWLGLNTEPINFLEWQCVAVDPQDGRRVLTTSNWTTGVYLSTDGGQRFDQVLKGPQNRVSFRCLAFAPADSAVVYAGSAAFISGSTFEPKLAARGIYVSDNGGRKWREANDATSDDAHVAALAVDPRDADTVWAATVNHGLLTSTDGGGHWASAAPGLTATSPPTAVAIDPTDANMVLVGLWKGAVRRTANGGASWQAAAAGLDPNACIASIVFDPTNHLVVYAADLLSGVYRSTNGGQSWQVLNTGLRMRSVNSLAISGDGRALYAGTEGEGVFRINLGP